MGTSGWDRFRARNIKLRAVNAKETTHADHAKRAAV
jgi:hypothetical protein